MDTASSLLTRPYDDLPYSAEVRRLVGAHLALGVLPGERPEAIRDRAALYAQTRCMEAAAAVRLPHLLEGSAAMPPEGGSQGIAIRYAAGHPCMIC